jgi:competence protein ComGC
MPKALSRTRASRWCAAGVLGFVALAGLLKLGDLPHFAASLDAWTILPVRLRGPLAVLVPCAEVLLGGLWIVGVRRRAMELAAMAMLVLFMGAYLWQSQVWKLPTCGCLGAISRYISLVDAAPAVIGRNILLIAALGFAIVAGRPPGARRPARGAVQAVPAGARAFTIIELLAVIGVVAVLLALSLPGLRGSRESSRETRDLSNLRSHAGTLQAYGAEHKDSFPALTRPVAGPTPIRCESAGIEVQALYFEAADVWHIGLADAFYAGDWRSPSFWNPWRPPALRAGYVMSCSLLADPDYYIAQRRAYPPDQLRSVRLGEVLFTAKKAVYSSPRDPSLTQRMKFRLGAALADGHAQTVADQAAVIGYPGDGRYPDYTSHMVGILPLTHAGAGVRGRDLR